MLQASPWRLPAVASLLLLIYCGSVGHSAQIGSPLGTSPNGRPRARDIGISIGILPPGENNAITDVPGVLVGHQTLIDNLGGKVCMWNTVDIQWATSGKITGEDIRNEVAEMVRIYDIKAHRGGYIAKHYPQPWDINLPVDRQELIHDAFMANGCRL